MKRILCGILVLLSVSISATAQVEKGEDRPILKPEDFLDIAEEKPILLPDTEPILELQEEPAPFELSEEASEGFGDEQLIENFEFSNDYQDQDEFNFNVIEEQLEMENAIEGGVEDFSEEANQVKGIFEEQWKEAGSLQFIMEEASLEDEVLESRALFLSIISDPEELRTSGTKPFLEDSILVRGPTTYDSRLEIRQLSPTVDWMARILKTKESVGMVVEKERLFRVTDSLYQLDYNMTLGNLYNLCPGTAFEDQPVNGTGTAFVVSEITMATAGHVFERPIEDYAIVFGFELANGNGTVDPFVLARDIYFPKRLVLNDDELDVAVFVLDRKTNRPTLPLSNSQNAPLESSIYMVGHPNGLPTKAAINARILSGERNHFYTSLDAFQGNSGSPVCDFQTGEVLGILVAGGKDYEWTGSCNRTTSCRIPYCPGEKVLRIESVVDALPGK